MTIVLSYTSHTPMLMAQQLQTDQKKVDYNVKRHPSNCMQYADVQLAL